MCSDLPITRAVQQVATKTRITTRRNILTPDLLPPVWPRCWVKLIYSGGMFSSLHVSQHVMIRYQSCGGESYDIPGSGLLLICRITYCLMTWLIGPQTCCRCATWLFIVWILIKVKIRFSVRVLMSQIVDGMSDINLILHNCDGSVVSCTRV